MKRLSWALFFLMNTSLPALFAQQALQQAVQAFVNDPALKEAGLGVAIVEVATNQLIAGHQENQLLIPASSLKVLTTASALISLGPDYQFKTTIEYDGVIEQGTLNGNIYIYGTGDPTLGSPEWDAVMDMEAILQQITVAIKAKGIQRIEGQVVADASFFSGTPTPASWQESDVGNYYGAGVWGVNIHENLFYLPFRQVASKGQKPGIASLRPAIPDLTISNQVRSAGANTGDNAYIYGGAYEYAKSVKGTIPAGSGIFTIKGSVPDAPLLAAQQLTECLKAEGVPVSQPPAATLRAGSRAYRKSIYTVWSPKLADIVFRANQESVNLYCEAMLKAIGKQQAGSGDRLAGVKAIQAIWKDRGLDLQQITVEDGSGLSRSDRISALQLAGVVRKCLKDPVIAEVFKESLPVAGISGTLEHSMIGTTAAGRLSAKTGSMRGVRSYTGFVQNKAGQWLCFSLIANDYTCSTSTLKRKMEELLIAISDA